MKAIEAAADRAGVSYAAMMEAAGRAVAEAVSARVNAAQTHAVVLCGKGNNGGDGLVAAHYLAAAGARVSVYTAQPVDESDSKIQRLRADQVSIADAEHDSHHRVLQEWVRAATVVIDAVFGTGARLPLAGPLADLLQHAGKLLNDRAAHPPLRVAVDCPSGLDCDTGALDALALPADVTVTFAAAKRGQFTFPAADFIGALTIADIGVPADLPELTSITTELATAARVRDYLPARPRNAHKGTFGRALVVAGSVNYTGAAHLAGSAAYRIGAGLVTLAVPGPLHPILAGQLPEATWLLLPHERGFIAEGGAEMVLSELPNTQALLIGPGFGQEPCTADFLKRVAHRPPSSVFRPMVIDADGLKLLTRLEQWRTRLPPNSVLTPHPGEMAVLTGLSKAALQEDRLGLAQKYATEWGQVLVLKGAFTVVAAPDGRATVMPFATPALARAGTGDVLAGMVVGLLAQGVAPYEAAVAGAYLHGRAGELAAEAVGTTASVLASDVLAQLPRALKEMEPNGKRISG